MSQHIEVDYGMALEFGISQGCYVLAEESVSLLEAENAALKEQVARLEDLNRKLCDKTNALTIQSARLEETITSLQSKSAALVDALRSIASWEMPSTGEFWDAEETRPVSFLTNYGSQGEQAYIRNIANAALAAFKGENR